MLCCGGMIGKPLSERFFGGPLSEERALSVLNEMLGAQAAHLVQVRAQGPKMIACLVARTDKVSARLCRSLGIEVKPGKTAVFGLAGEDAARLFPQLPAHQRSWLAAPCGPRETKVLLIASGTALLSLESRDGKVSVTAVATIAS